MKIQNRYNFYTSWATALASLSCVAAIQSSAWGYGPDGHEIVGDIADQLIKNTPAAAHVHTLLGNNTLGSVASWADDAKYSPNPHDAEMMAFINANPKNSGVTDHWNYHFTDIPVEETHYRANSVGAAPMDVVHMIRNCILILQKKDTPATNPTHIPESTALRLLVHYVGDVHQPLHVGAAYFDAQGNMVDPNQGAHAKKDTGGNDITFRGANLHHYWDNDVVKGAMHKAGASTPQQFASYAVQHPPQGWQSGPSVTGWSVKWANEVLPIAADAHGKLTITPGAHGKWTAKEKAPVTPAQYDDWASGQASTELERAGYRLAAVLQTVWAH